MTIKRAAIAILIAIPIVALYFANFGISTTRIEKLRQLVEQNIRLGASPEQVTHFLDAQHLDHSGLMRPSPGQREIIAAIKRRSKVSLISQEDIQLIFSFDENRRLVKIELVPAIKYL